jgi:glyoxylase-like metal-dependent hydrolase (beta-lactamase superfamily II)
MNLYPIHTGMLKLDGGAMFGVVPKTIWSRYIQPDENNLCSLAMRCLLVEDGNRLILIDNGIGDKQSDKFFSYYYLDKQFTLEGSLKKAGFHSNDITDVLLTHLHFDHCGGGVFWKDRDKNIPGMTFKNATYWSNPQHWEWAVNPNPREKASFLKENLLPMMESGQIKMITKEGGSPFENVDLMFVDGHTEKMMIPVIRYRDRTIAFAADLLPTAAHLPVPYIMAYDTRPLLSMEEKERFLKEAFDNNCVIFFEHDPEKECCTLSKTEKGIRIDRSFNLGEII